MANVWFVRRVGGVWKKVGDEPAFRQPLRELIFKLDLGPQRRLGQDSFPEPPDASTANTVSNTKVYVEVTEDDLQSAYFGGYFPGWYDSPYNAPEVERRLHAKTSAVATHG